MEFIIQTKDGIVVSHPYDHSLYLEDNHFNVIRDYDFISIDITLDGYAIDMRGRNILNMKNGIVRTFNFNVVYDQYNNKITNGMGETYDFERDVWYQDLYVSNDAGFLSFKYGKTYKTEMSVHFNYYVYREGKSFLFYFNRYTGHNKIKVYDGELYDLSRLDDFLHGKDRAYDDENYAELIKEFNFPGLTAGIKSFPDHIVVLGRFASYILDLNILDLYSFDKGYTIVAIINNTLIDEYRSDPKIYKLPSKEISDDTFKVYEGF